MVKFRKKTYRKLNKKSNRSIKGGTRKYHCFKGPRTEGSTALFPENFDGEASSLSSQGRTGLPTPPSRRDVGLVRTNSKDQDWDKPAPYYDPLHSGQAVQAASDDIPSDDIPSWTSPGRGSATPRRPTKKASSTGRSPDIRPSKRPTKESLTEASPRGSATPRRKKRPPASPTPPRQPGNTEMSLQKKKKGNKRGGTKRKRKNKKKKKRNL